MLIALARALREEAARMGGILTDGINVPKLTRIDGASDDIAVEPYQASFRMTTFEGARGPREYTVTITESRLR